MEQTGLRVTAPIEPDPQWPDGRGDPVGVGGGRKTIVETTMIYVAVLNKGPMGVVSPVDTL